MAPVALNKAQGARFEALFAARCGVDGLKALKNPLSFKYLPGGRIQPIRADLDFRVLRRDGRVCYVDTKSFDEEAFTFSQLETHQIQRAMQYDSFKVPAGFVVLLRPLDRVFYYPAHVIFCHGPRTRFLPSHGHPLGLSLSFGPGLIFDAHNL